WRTRDDASPAAAGRAPFDRDRDSRGAAPRGGGSERRPDGDKPRGYSGGAGRSTNAKPSTGRTFKPGGFRAAPGSARRPRPDQ
ncbi:MAG TPA: hypothetical protein VGM78_10065, partial [Ilumatobacteraceae bacterium]